jgi:hypothetical protein
MVIATAGDLNHHDRVQFRKDCTLFLRHALLDLENGIAAVQFIVDGLERTAELLRAAGVGAG